MSSTSIDIDPGDCIVDPETGETADMNSINVHDLQDILASSDGVQAERIGDFLYKNYSYNKDNDSYYALGAMIDAAMERAKYND